MAPPNNMHAKSSRMRRPKAWHNLTWLEPNRAKQIGPWRQVRILMAREVNTDRRHSINRCARVKYKEFGPNRTREANGECAGKTPGGTIMLYEFRTANKSPCEKLVWVSEIFAPGINIWEGSRLRSAKINELPQEQTELPKWNSWDDLVIIKVKVLILLVTVDD